MPPGITLAFVIVAFAGSLVTAAAAIWGPRARARRKALRALRSGSPTLADHSLATVTGKVRPAATALTAPLSGRRCIAYRAVARIYETRASRVSLVGQKRNLIAEIAEARMVSFELDTVHGIVIVDGDEPNLVVPAVPVIPRKIGREGSFLAAHGTSPHETRTAGFDEVIVEPGDKISVHGLVVVEADPNVGNYREVGQRYRIIADPDHPLTIGAPV
jgi:hypothetical protein